MYIDVKKYADLSISVYIYIYILISHAHAQATLQIASKLKGLAVEVYMAPGAGEVGRHVPRGPHKTSRAARENA
jgi:hypothetical protein